MRASASGVEEVAVVVAVIGCAEQDLAAAISGIGRPRPGVGQHHAGEDELSAELTGPVEMDVDPIRRVGAPTAVGLAVVMQIRAPAIGLGWKYGIARRIAICGPHADKTVAYRRNIYRFGICRLWH